VAVSQAEVDRFLGFVLANRWYAILLEGRLSRNPALDIPDAYAAKIGRWLAAWSALSAEPWPEPVRANGPVAQGRL
jgi:hypothetical protein